MFVNVIQSFHGSYEQNLDKFVDFIINSQDIIIAPEVFATGFDYQNWQKANAFSEVILNRLLSVSKDKLIIWSMIQDNQNIAYAIKNHQIIHKRAKYNLFGYEKKYFHQGTKPHIFYIDGLKCAILICFEIRFIKYWLELQGVDIVFVPAQWGQPRKHHLVTLSNALSLSLQSYVVVADGVNHVGGVIFWDEEIRSDVVRTQIDLQRISKIRKKFVLE
ncbi:MAG: carbon-nitrogen hydrolase family protein [Epsilonproteobacteria bacterium]|nr:carbon-nitrogen hydrolase family protein [Campylobacterota bacterium]